jgi:hypothetical protein
LANTRFSFNPLQRLSQLKLLGIFFVLLACLFSFFIAMVLVEQSSIQGVKFAILMFVAGVTFVWFLTTEKIPLALLIMLLYTGLLEGVLKFNTSGTTFLLIFLIRNVLTVLLVLNFLIKAHNRKLREIGYEFSWPPFTLLIGFYVLWCLISILHPDSLNLMNSIAGVRPHIEFVPLYFIGFLICKKEPKWFVHLLFIMVIIGVLNSVAAIHQYKIGPDAMPQVWGAGYEQFVAIEDEGTSGSQGDRFQANKRVYYDDDHKLQLRPPGLGSDATYPAIVGQIGAFSVLLLLFYYLKTRNYWLFGFLAMASLILFAGIIVAVSRSYLLLSGVGLAAGLLVYIRDIFSGQKLKIIILLIVTSALLVGNYALRAYISESVYDRFENISTPEKLYYRLQEEKFSTWGYTINYILESPLGRGLGKVGPGAGFFVREGVDDSSKLGGSGETHINYILSELGVVGLFLIFIIAIGTFLKSIAILKNSPPDSYQRLSAMMVFLFLLVYFLISPWGGGGVGFPRTACFWLFMGCFWALHNRPEEFFLSTKFRQW